MKLPLRLPLLAISLFLVCTTTLFAQQPPVMPDKTDKTTVPPPKPSVEASKPVSSAPLQIKPPKDGENPSLSSSFKDYTQRENKPDRTTAQRLPLFGYDLFRSARETVDAQREFIRRQSVSNLTQEPNRAVPNASSEQPKPTERDRNTEPTRPTLPPPQPEGTPTPTQPNQPPVATNNASVGSPAPRRTNRLEFADETDDQVAYQTPIGPIGLLYRNISASIPPNYQLSGGDVLSIRLTSPTLAPITFRKTVDARGQIRLQYVGDVVVRGKTLEAAERDLQSRLRPYYKDVQVAITTDKLRTIQVLVSGAAYEPGTYTLPAVATVYNLLNIAGGPTDEGSLRSVELRRGGKRIATLDIYKLLIGDASFTDVGLQAGDVLIIPPRKSRVSVVGEALYPAVFELLEGESLQDALRYAGGIKPSGLNQNVRIETVVPGQERILKDVNVKTANLREPVYDGDTIEIFSVRDRIVNRVTVEGAVDRPNDYALAEGMKVTDLLEKARGTISEAYLQKADLYRWQKDNSYELVVIDLEKALANDPKHNLPLHKWDKLRVYTREEVAWTGRRRVTVEGAVKRPGVYEATKNMRVSDLLRLAGGPTPDADMERAHLLHHRDDAPYQHEYVNIGAVTRGDTQKDALVFDNDRLIVYRVNESIYTPEHRVDIKGEVVNPGRYPRFQGMRVSDLLNFSGGLKPSAAGTVVVANARRVPDESKPLTMKLVKLQTNGKIDAQDDVELKDGDVLSVQAVGGFQPEVQAVTVMGAVQRPGTVFLSSKQMRLSDALREAGGLRTEAFPQGAIFYRDPKVLVTTGQRSLVQNLSALNDLFNDSETKREIAKAQLELIRATGAAIQESTPVGLTGQPTNIPNPAATSAATVTGAQLVTAPRKLIGSALDPNGYIAINLPQALAKPAGSDDIILVDGDIIEVPEKPTTVQVVGALNSPRGVLFVPGKDIQYYVELAGGFAPDAAKDRIAIFQMGGGVVPARRARQLQPGDVIFVPTKVLAAKITKRGADFDTFFRSLTNYAIIFRLATGVFNF